MVSGVPRICMRITPTPASAATGASAGSNASPETSFTTAAPAAIAARATGALRVSTDTGPKLGTEALQAGGHAVRSRERGEPARRRAHQRPPRAREHIGAGLRAPVDQRLAFGVGDVVEDDGEGLYAGRGEPRRLSVPPARRQRCAHRFRGVGRQQRELHLKAWTTCSRAARHAGKNPPTSPIVTAKATPKSEPPRRYS